MPGAETPSTVKLPRNGAYELYEYPARALDTAASERASKLRMQSVEADHEAHAGASTVRELAPGARLMPFDVADPTNRFETAVVLTVTHRAVDPSYDANSGEPSYENAFTALPARLPATPHRATHRPRIEGSQIAVIAGPEGEEIHTDQYGRVKLWFPWDRRAKKDGSDTRWVRVAQPWAGGSWGSQVIPRIGMEAVVSFEGGDPDRPIVTALVPNPQQKVPYDLPANKTKTVFRTNTHKSKDWTRMNELSFEDASDAEKIYIHAQRDHEIHVRNNYASRVDVTSVQSIGNASYVEIGKDKNDLIGGNFALTIGASEIQQNNTAGFGLFDPTNLQFAYEATMPAEMDETRGTFMLSVAKGFHTFVLDSMSQQVSGALQTSVGQGHTLTVGAQKMERVHLSSYESIGGGKRIHAKEDFEVRCGKSYLVLKYDGTIVLEGVNIKIRGTRIDLNE